MMSMCSWILYIRMYFIHSAWGVNTMQAAYISTGEKISACHTSLPWHTHVFFSQANAFPIKDSSFTLNPWIAVFQKRQHFLTEDWKRCCHWYRLQLRLGVSEPSSLNQKKNKKQKKQSVKSTECSSVYWQVRTIIESNKNKKVRAGLQLICLIYGFWCFSLENVTVLPASS